MLLSFETHTAPPKEVNILPQKEQSAELEKLQETLKKMSKVKPEQKRKQPFQWVSAD